MKLSTTLLGAIALLGMTGAASAQTKIYITGSTAFRAPTIAAINNVLAGSGTIVVASTANTNADTWTGGSLGGTPVTIKASFTGSGAGIQTVAGAPNFTVGFLPDGATGTSNADPTNSNNPHESAVPDMCMSDVFQPTTLFKGTYGGYTYSTLTDKKVGIVAFTFAASTGFPSGMNMTPQIAQKLFPGGDVPLSEFTGNPNDVNTGVIATGRNADSGTRLTAMAETNVGVNTTLTQYLPTVSGGSSGIGGTVTDLNEYPQSVINGVTYKTGDGGESSGSSLRVYLTDTVSQNAVQEVDPTFNGAGYLVTYLGVSDYSAVSGTTPAAVALNYNGVAESAAGIEQGSYTFWGYEHLDYLSSISGIKSTFAGDLVTGIKNLTTSQLAGNVALADMSVQRFADGGTVSSLLH